MLVYSDSVLCLGKLHNHPGAIEKNRDQICDFQLSNEYAELYEYFPGFTSTEILKQIPKI